MTLQAAKLPSTPTMHGGNVISVKDANNTNITSSLHIGNANPIRYRGYYMDSETGMYYLQSRYYDSKTHRFLNSDNVVSDVGALSGYNVFSYCANNPVNLKDESGNWPNWVKKTANAVKNTAQKAVNTVKKVSANVVNKVKSLVSKPKNVKLATPNRRPNTGAPGSTYKAPNGDKRTYGSDGKPKHDYDHDDHGAPDKHPHDSNGGHNHDWDWSKNPPRQDPYAIDMEAIAGLVLVSVCVIGIAIVAADDVTGIGVADDVLFGPLGAGAGKGLIMILG